MLAEFNSPSESRITCGHATSQMAFLLASERGGKPACRQTRQAARGRPSMGELSRLRADQPKEFGAVIVEAGENGLQIFHADVLGENFSDDGAEVRGKREVAAFVELVIVQAGPFAVDLAALHVAAHDEH